MSPLQTLGVLCLRVCDLAQAREGWAGRGGVRGVQEGPLQAGGPHSDRLPRNSDRGWDCHQTVPGPSAPLPFERVHPGGMWVAWSLL